LQLPYIKVKVGRLNAGEMIALIQQENSKIVIDATHPYAVEASANIAAACTKIGMPFIRINRQESSGLIGKSNAKLFPDAQSLLAYLETTRGVIFVTCGAKEAALFTNLAHYKERIYFRLLPTLDGLKTCLDLGYPPQHLILQWGPFSHELNRAMFTDADARILVTKESGANGGFAEKLQAAEDCHMDVAILARPLVTDSSSSLVKFFSVEETITFLDLNFIQPRGPRKRT
jgi:precorrin-6x reductase